MNQTEPTPMNARQLAKRIIKQRGKGEDAFEPDDVVVARALLQVDADYGCEIHDPAGTIWEYSKMVEQQRDELVAVCEKLLILLDDPALHDAAVARKLIEKVKRKDPT